jgi:hypothetical protein
LLAWAAAAISRVEVPSNPLAPNSLKPACTRARRVWSAEAGELAPWLCGSIGLVIRPVLINRLINYKYRDGFLCPGRHACYQARQIVSCRTRVQEVLQLGGRAVHISDKEVA